jgi:hypothetical protein
MTHDMMNNSAIVQAANTGNLYFSSHNGGLLSPPSEEHLQIGQRRI